MGRSEEVRQTPPSNLPHGFRHLGVLVPLRDKSEFTSDPETGRGPGHPSPSFGRFQQPTGAVMHTQSFRLRGQVTQCLSNSEHSDWKQAESKLPGCLCVPCAGWGLRCVGPQRSPGLASLWPPLGEWVKGRGSN